MVVVMQTIIVRKHKSGVLLSLADLLQLMRLKDIISWSFLEITLNGRGLPFGMSFDDFEAATRATTSGFAVSDQEFQAFLKSDFQIIDGVIEAWTGNDPTTCAVRIDCEDASQWEISTDLQEIITKLEQPDLWT